MTFLEVSYKEFDNVNDKDEATWITKTQYVVIEQIVAIKEHIDGSAVIYTTNGYCIKAIESVDDIIRRIKENNYAKAFYRKGETHANT